LTPEILRKLLSEPEGPGLDFKQELKLYGDNGKPIPRERDEFIKDILALANGNESVAGAEKFLIFGAADELKPDGTRELYDIAGKTPDPQHILQTVNSACEPNLSSVDCTVVTLESKHLFVITIPPTPYVHETTRELKTPKTTYHEYTVFMRRHEAVCIASTRERETLLAAKEHHFRQINNVNPVVFGALLTGWILASMTWPSIESRPNLNLLERVILAFIMFVIGAALGAGLGMATRDAIKMGVGWRRYVWWQRLLLTLAGALVFWRF
jgi:hypothetical protein